MLGLLLGAGAWGPLFQRPGTTACYLQVIIVLLISVVLYIRYVYYSAEQRPRSRQRYTYALFVANFLLYITLGGIGAERAAVFHPSGSVGGSKEVRYETTGQTKSANRADTISLAHKDERKPSGTRQEGDRTGTRIGYILLFLAGLVLAYGAAAISCELACAGYGFASVMVLLLGTGILAGGLYFFGRAVDRNMKRYRDMTRDERKREKRRFFRTWGGVVAGLVLLWLIAAISG
ncbi:hypothetical protein GCM10023189_56100 [Nibrella saemangeumensis]|uniref:Uncharacterized protein n=1 Tax=Nibrella saemangeumensis TaxID=1084526 RepID=A0ABP8NLQ0_9BACT